MKKGFSMLALLGAFCSVNYVPQVLAENGDQMKAADAKEIPQQKDVSEPSSLAILGLGLLGLGLVTRRRK